MVNIAVLNGLENEPPRRLRRQASRSRSVSDRRREERQGKKESFFKNDLGLFVVSA